MFTLLLFVLILIVLGFIFVVMIFPAWMLFSCIFSRTLSGIPKFVWIVVMLMSWPLGGFLYALLGSDRPVHRVISLGLGAMLLGAVLCGYLGLNWSATVLRAELNRNLSRLQTFIGNELAADRFMTLRDDLVKLKESFDELNKDIGLQLRMIDRLTLFEEIMRDGQITEEEMTTWKAQYGETIYVVPRRRDRVQQYWQNLQNLERWERIKNSI